MEIGKQQQHVVAVDIVSVLTAYILPRNIYESFGSVYFESYFYVHIIYKHIGTLMIIITRKITFPPKFSRLVFPPHANIILAPISDRCLFQCICENESEKLTSTTYITS